MRWYKVADSSLTTGGTTEETIQTIGVPGRYRVSIDDNAVAAGTTPTIYEYRVKANARESGTERVIDGFPIARVGGLKIGLRCDFEFDVADTATVTAQRRQGSDSALPYRVERHGGFPVTVQSDGGNSATQFKTDRTEATDDFFKDCYVRFLNGSLAGELKKATGYVGATKILTFSSGFTGTPSNGDDCEIIG